MADQDKYNELIQRTRETMKHLFDDWLQTVTQSLDGADFWKTLADAEKYGKPQAHQNAYRVLGIEDSATDEEIKKRYRELVKRLHPDVAGQETEHLFKLVQAAYEEIGRERRWN